MNTYFTDMTSSENITTFFKDDGDEKKYSPSNYRSDYATVIDHYNGGDLWDKQTNVDSETCFPSDDYSHDYERKLTQINGESHLRFNDKFMRKELQEPEMNSSSYPTSPTLRQQQASSMSSVEDNDLLPFLTKLRIQKEVAISYYKTMKENGFDDVASIDDLREEDLKSLGIKVGHIRRMKRAASLSSFPLNMTQSSSIPMETIRSPEHILMTSSLGKELFREQIDRDFDNNHIENSIQRNRIDSNTTTNYVREEKGIFLNQKIAGITDLSMSLDLAEAQKRLQQQEARIRSLEGQISTASLAPTRRISTAEPCKLVKSKLTHVKSAPVTKKLTSEERLRAHRERKMRENVYKEKCGKWEEPAPLDNNSITKKVPTNKAFVDRLTLTAVERRIQDQREGMGEEDDFEMVDSIQTGSSSRRTDRRTSAERHVQEEMNSLKAKKQKRKSMPKLSSRNNHYKEKSSAKTKHSIDRIDQEIKSTLNHANTPEVDQYAVAQNMRIHQADEPCDHSNYGESMNCGSPARISQDLHTPYSSQCETCNSTSGCEEDIDSPGIFYCKKCWNDYDNGYQEQRNGKDAKEKTSGELKKGAKTEIAQKSEKAIWIIHDNPQLGNRIVSNGTTKCLLETKDPLNKNCVRILLGSIDFSGCVSSSGLNGRCINETNIGAECIRIRDVIGYVVNHDEVETRSSKDGSIIEFQLNQDTGVTLTGSQAQSTAQEFLQNCKGSVDVMIDPQMAHGNWYPQREANTSVWKKIAPQFRSRGVGYIRLGDDMSKNGLAFISSDECKSFFSSSSKMCTIETKSVKTKVKKRIPLKGMCCKKNTIITDDETEECEESAEDLGELLKDFQICESKWQEKSDLIKRLGMSISSKNRNNVHVGVALTEMQNIVSSKNVNVHVLRVAVIAVGKIGFALRHELVSHASWRTIMCGMLSLLKNKQIKSVAKETLNKLHGTSYTLLNSLPVLSQSLGFGKSSHAMGGKTANSPSTQAGGTTNCVEVIEWLSDVIEEESSMEDVCPILDKAGLTTMSSYFLAFLNHRDPKCRKYSQKGLTYAVIYGIKKSGMGQEEALSICSELKSTHSKVWSSILRVTRKILEAQ